MCGEQKNKQTTTKYMSYTQQRTVDISSTIQSSTFLIILVFSRLLFTLTTEQQN